MCAEKPIKGMIILGWTISVTFIDIGNIKLLKSRRIKCDLHYMFFILLLLVSIFGYGDVCRHRLAPFIKGFACMPLNVRREPIKGATIPGRFYTCTF